METKWVVIDNDTKQSVSIETPCLETAQNWAETLNRDCHESGGSSTQYGVDEAELDEDFLNKFFSDHDDRYENTLNIINE